MGNLNCSAENGAHLAAVVRDFCPAPDYSLGPLYNMLTADSSRHLSEHYAAVQASLTPQQQQDFTRTLRSTFGKKGKVSYGGVGVVALSLAVLFDTVARQVKGEYVSDQDPIPGLFLREPTGTYPLAVYTVSKYLRLVPYIANNPTRMADETERYLLELNRAIVRGRDTHRMQMKDITTLNIARFYVIGKQMLIYLKSISGKIIHLNDIWGGKGPEMYSTLNCDPEVASERFRVELDSLGERTKEAFKTCDSKDWTKTVAETYMYLDLSNKFMSMISFLEEPPSKRDFNLKRKALGKWM